MKKLNKIGGLVNKIKEKFSIETIMERNRLQYVFKKITIIAVIIFSIFTIIIYETLKFSYNYQNKVYEDGYLAYTYSNKINEDVLNIRIASITHYSSYNEATEENLETYVKDIDDNIQKYKMLRNLSDEEKKLIDEFIKLNTIDIDKLKKITEDTDKLKTVTENEIEVINSSGDKRIELSNKLINCATNRIDMLNKQNRKIKKTVMYIIVIINFTMISLFILMIYIVKKISKRAEYYALYSSITGLPNKNHVANTIAKDIKLYKDRFALLISLDIDNFKAVNDTLGHDSGDKLLNDIGKRFRRVIHMQDNVYHMGGDEFLFLITSVYNKNQSEIMVNNIQNVFKEPFNIEGKKIDYVTASLGIAIINQDGSDFETLYNYADDAMYESKRLGKNRYMFYEEEMYSNVYEKTMKKKAIEEGIKNGEFKVFYQPKVSSEEKFIGAEALVRWIKEDNKIIPPSEFIEFAEEEGLIKDIGEDVIINVCKKLAEWLEKGYRDFRIAINLSAEQLIDESLCDNALKIIEKFKIPFEYIEFEVTESTIIKDFDIAIKSIKKIKSYGIKVSLDDFGTGYSSLNYLKKLEVDSVKIDKSFIDTLVFDDGTNVMVSTIIKMCHYFGYEVVAEGVEKREQIECLQDLNCDIFQGYYFGKPMKDEEFEKGFLSL
ncbi:cyclic di-GMP phosphodiesterase Gmr [Clostridium puniceum]|uniref:Cyclic di-GMP phosphodiesterase Gmr n=1 Tax=Clostridium puniceum TaxID=29367 RepID=A0A1S8TMP1_9CLOT|nr:bifunctional diguanylate cyclase/phosphodiesterase [Clostridium puniceum]OOM79037.1 cyclic di-GMP phosphodiesterase Gmr [Clostridium puniceum]